MELDIQSSLETSKTEGGSKKAVFHLEKCLEHIRHYLPSQAPLKDFIHHNTLHAFQDRPFRQAVFDASWLYGARATLSLKEYAALQAEGKVDRHILARVREGKELAGQASMVDLPRFRLRNHWDKELGSELSVLVNPLFFRLVSQFLDQGIAYWPMPGADHKSFFQCVLDLTSPIGFPLPPLSSEFCQTLLALGPKSAVEHALAYLVKGDSAKEDYLWETLDDHRGWSGLVSVVEQNPEFLTKQRQITLMEFTAVKLILEVGILKTRLGDRFQPIQGRASDNGFGFTKKPPPATAYREEELLQEALEETYYERVSRLLVQHPEQRPTSPVSAQVFFCIDDRECSLRRHLETEDPSIETFGTAGFFGIDAMVHRNGEIFPVKSCPAPVRPRHLIRELPPEEIPVQQRLKTLTWMQDVHGGHSKTLIEGLLHLPVKGFKACFRLISDVLNPMAHASAYGVDRLPYTGPMQMEANGEHSGSFQFGYTIDEMAARVSGVLRSSGLVRDFAPVVAFLAHGSSSVNNPYFAAYDCGACSGKPGAPNAKGFATIANRQEVREVLARDHGIVIPSETVFIGGLHDTCRDEIVFFGIQKWPETIQKRFHALQSTLERALDLNALERSRKFDLIPKNITPKEARKWMRNRALSIFEPRPELNHATNAACIVGRRALTRGLSLDRRSFLQSYDPALDPEGKILGGILAAVIPVCGGINLEYYFSRIDPTIYGAGTKLPHNIVGLLGVINGAEGDVITGLPTQMTELHDPIRLMLVIEQKPDLILTVLSRNPAIEEWVRNEWVQLFAIDPSSKKICRYQKGDFR